MSYKVYTGIRFKTSDIVQLLSNLNEFRGIVCSEIQHEAAKLVAARAVRLIDDAAIGVEEKCDCPLISANEEITSVQKEHNLFNFSVSILTDGKGVYGIVFGRNTWFSLLLLEDWVEEFGYWDNTDRPDEISAQEWKRRAKIWRDVLSGNYTVTNVSFNASVDADMEVFQVSVEPVMEKLPSYSTRLVEASRRLFLHRKYTEAQNEKDRDALSLKLLKMDFSKLTGPDLDEFNRAQADAQVMLKPSLTTDDLLGK